MHEGLTYRCEICETINYIDEPCQYKDKWWHSIPLLGWLIANIKEG